MTYSVIMAILFVIVLHSSQARPGDCNENYQYGTNCNFYCGFETPYSYCANDLCCCGYNNANSWKAFRWNEGEGGCRDDPNPRVPADKVCNSDRCETACQGTGGYHIEGEACWCVVYGTDKDHPEVPGWRFKYYC